MENKSFLGIKIIGYILITIMTIIFISLMIDAEEKSIEINSSLENITHKIARYVALKKREARDLAGLSAENNYGMEILHPELPNLLEEDTTFDYKPEFAAEGGILNLGTNADIDNFNWILENTANYSYYIALNVHYGLASGFFKDADKSQPGLAFRIEQVETENGMDYYVYLKPGVYWHRPNLDWTNETYSWIEELYSDRKNYEVTTDDFVFSFNLIKDPTVQAGHMSNYYQDLEEIIKLDDFRMIFRWSKKVYIAKGFTMSFQYVPEHIYSRYEDGSPIPKELIGTEFNNHWFNNYVIGAGPYRFIEHESSSHFTLERNEEYVGTMPNAYQMNYFILPDDEQSILKLKSGEIDQTILDPAIYKDEILKYQVEKTIEKDYPLAAIIFSAIAGIILIAGISLLIYKYKKDLYSKYGVVVITIPSLILIIIVIVMICTLPTSKVVSQSESNANESVFSQDLNDDKLHYDIVQRHVFRYIGWNLKKPLFQDKLVRQALTHACNRELILNEIFLGLGRIAHGSFYPESYQCNKDIKPWEYSLDLAREKLAQAGWSDIDNDGILEKEIDGEITEFEFQMLIYGSSPDFKDLSEIYKRDLLSIGIRMIVLPLEWNTLLEKMDNRNFDAVIMGWATSSDSDPYQIWHSSQADEPISSNYIGFKNAEADVIIETGRETFDMQKREELYNRFEEILHEEQPYTFLFWQDGIYAWNPRLKYVEFEVSRPYFNPRVVYIEQ